MRLKESANNRDSREPSFFPN
uniref:Uncharacterized protein n=1 Tax=Rhizophora mucronata TaxID=61149 RepID=A0A2P2QBW9_RHIMU